MANQNTTPFGQLSFPHLYTPRPASPGAEPKYSLSLLLDKEAQSSPEYVSLKQQIMDAARQKWGNKADEMIKNGSIRLPIQDAAKKSQYDGYEEGKVFINMSSNKAPGVIDGALRDVAEADVYPGCVGRCTYGVYAYDNVSKGVAVGLNNVQITDFTAPRLDGRIAANKDFDSMDMAVAPMEHDDEIPF